MPKTSEQQRWIHVHKDRVEKDFLQVANADWMQANKRLTPYGLQLYLYLASNLNDYQFALSPADAEERVAIRSTTFHKYFRLLEIEGYVVWRHGNVYDFYTSPRPADKRTHPDKHCDSISFEDVGSSSSPDEAPISAGESSENASRSATSSNEATASPCESVSSPSNIQIENREIEKDREDAIENIDAGTPRAPAAPDADASVWPSREKPVRIVYAPPKRNPTVFPVDYFTDENGNFKF